MNCINSALISVVPKRLLTFNISTLIVYRMGRLCGGAHEISGIKAPLFSVVGGWRVLGVVGWVSEWVGGDGVSCLVGGWMVVWVMGWVGGVGGSGWVGWWCCGSP